MEYNSEYCHVEYLERDNIVFLEWKKFCCGDSYRAPVQFVLDLLKEHKNSNFLFDARNGFEDEKEDVKWGFEYFLPTMAKTDCKYVSFIMNEVSDIDEEMSMWEREFKKYFKVKKFDNFDKALEYMRKVTVEK